MIYDEYGALLRTEMPELGEPVRGKVRDIYDLGDSLLMVTTDRISAFDVVLPNGIPDKGKVLTQLSLFWFDRFDWMKNHVLSSDVNEFPEVCRAYRDDLKDRTLLVKKCVPYPIECVVRGYLIGSGWKDYQNTREVCGIRLRDGYRLADRLEEPLFTPAYKAPQGEHDENISFAKAVELVGENVATELKENALRLYREAADYARERGIIIADTKFEFGQHEGDLVLIDEVLTCDSSRFWPADRWKPGENPPSFDKQYVRDYLETLDWDKKAPGPKLPEEVVCRTSELYREALKLLADKSL
ncbi:MAG: phosphoribosylaminoimidazolesuccinocarboxamide synthase [Lentisphaerae bacterium]|nr:MAG: phosphoribosylaminoimidazolesuccinocarboxamide synthase [Lentisphaerota bacterium]